MSWQQSHVVEERRRFGRAAFGKVQTCGALCHGLGISRKPGDKWMARFEARGRAGRAAGSRAPRWKERVWSLRRRPPRWGARQRRAGLGRRDRRASMSAPARVYRNGRRARPAHLPAHLPALPCPKACARRPRPSTRRHPVAGSPALCRARVCRSMGRPPSARPRRVKGGLPASPPRRTPRQRPRRHPPHIPPHTP